MRNGLSEVVRAVLAPRSDPQFANHPAHGREAQLALLKVVLSFCKLRRTAIDVGAHIGLWTQELARRFERTVAFEPNPETWNCLLLNTPLGTELHNVALGSTDSECAIELPPGGNSGMWHTAPGTGVKCRRLDSYTIPRVDLLKIDVEGQEGHVILGARDTLGVSRPAIVFEDNGLGPKYFGAEWINPKPLLAELGYVRMARVRKDEIWVPG